MFEKLVMRCADEVVRRLNALITELVSSASRGALATRVEEVQHLQRALRRRNLWRARCLAARVHAKQCADQAHRAGMAAGDLAARLAVAQRELQAAQAELADLSDLRKDLRAAEARTRPRLASEGS